MLSFHGLCWVVGCLGGSVVHGLFFTLFSLRTEGLYKKVRKLQLKDDIKLPQGWWVSFLAEWAVLFFFVFFSYTSFHLFIEMASV